MNINKLSSTSLPEVAEEELCAWQTAGGLLLCVESIPVYCLTAGCSAADKKGNQKEITNTLPKTAGCTLPSLQEAVNAKYHLKITKYD